MTKARDLSKLLSTANGKIEGANLDVSFENITDTGTEGTRVATGTSAQRGSTAGQLRFNSDTGLAEYYDGSQFKAIDIPPTVTAITPTEVASLDVGDATFTITGTNFQNSATVKFIGNDGTSVTASSVTVNSSTSITAVAPNSSFSNSKEPYDIQIINTNNLSGNLNDQIYIDNTVTWSTASGTIASINTTSTGTHVTVSATDPDSDTITYSETGGTVLSTAGLTLNSATGAISGTPNSAGTLNFTLRATANSKTADRAFSITVIAATLADFLVIAGGGGGGGHYYAGGGGAGGYRNSYNSESSGGGASAESALVLLSSEIYTITVGAGGAGGIGFAVGAKGSDSSISGTGITTVTSNGGGRGRQSSVSPDTDANGGSGGGGNSDSLLELGGSGTANQGYDGGDATTGGSTGTTGGGGGAGQVGQTLSSGVNGGNGGNGVASTITGSSVTRAGGGGGATYSGTAGTGGSGGGGNGANNNASTQATAGTANTGGGGGGGSHATNTPNGASGGSGVVILRMPTASYSGTYTGAETPIVDGLDTILVFNSSGSYTA